MLTHRCGDVRRGASVTWIKNVSNSGNVRFESKRKLCVWISSDTSQLIKIRTESSILPTIFYTAVFQREICSLLPQFAVFFFHACVSFELSLTVNTWGEWRGGVCPLFVQSEKLLSWDTRGRFACIRAAEGRSNPFLSSGAPWTHTCRRISMVKVMCAQLRPGELINVKKKFRYLALEANHSPRRSLLHVGIRKGSADLSTVSCELHLYPICHLFSSITQSHRWMKAKARGWDQRIATCSQLHHVLTVWRCSDRYETRQLLMC